MLTDVSPSVSVKCTTIFSFNDDGTFFPIPATGHNYELTGTEEVNGENIRTYVCTNCGAITTQNMGEQYEQVSSYIGYLFGQYQPYMWWVLLATESVAKGKLK